MTKKSRWLFGLAGVVIAGIAVLSFRWAGADPQQAQELRQFQFKKVQSINISVLRKEAFQELFAANPEVPKTNQAVVQLARRLYSSAGRAQIQEECAEHIYGTLFAALSNPDISDDARNEADNAVDADTPSLPQTYTSGHFKFYYTTNNANADHNVTLAEIQATATVLTNAWNDYATNFKEPKHYVSGGQKMVDVKVYYLGSSLFGVTNSSWNHIELNSKFVVKNACKRQTTPVHELFHRVQYAYGYISGAANLKWAVEATAAWSQKYRANTVGDWMSRMNEGLQNPDRALLQNPPNGRSYDACHFWVYLGQQGKNEKECVKLAWATYQTNGKNMKNAVETVIKTRIGAQYTFDAVAGWWVFANFHKDLLNARTSFDYQEDELTRTCGGVTYGPLATVPRTTQALNVGTNWTRNEIVTAYGADYYVFNIGATVKKVEIKVTATTKTFGYAIIEIKNNQFTTYQRTPAGGWDNYSYTKTLTPGQLSQVALVVIGNPSGGNYTVNAKGSS